MVSDEKVALRERMRRARRQIPASVLATSAADLTRHVLAAPAVAVAGCVAAYVPVGSEPGSVELVDALRTDERIVLLPVVRSDGELDWAAYDGSLRAGPLGLREPAGELLGPDALSRAQVVLAPALAVDRRGNRLGRGAGYFDRALARVRPTAPVAALLHDGELVDVVPVEDHDRPVTVAVTPELGWTAVGPAA